MHLSPFLALLEPLDYAAIAGISLLVAGSTAWLHRSTAELRRIEEKLDRLLQHAGLESAPVRADVPPDVEKLARHPDTRIEAIKLLREQRPGLGLAEAKAIVDRYSGQ
jgi:hypothetical protein